jgi:hypothetical protein
MLEVRELQVRYGTILAVEHLDLHVSAGEIVVLIGANGAGKDGKRRIVVTANVRGRDLGSFVVDAQRQVEQKVKLPSGYWIGWGGQFEQLVSATQRLTIVVPIALLLIFLLLFMSLGSMPDALLVFSGVPVGLDWRDCCTLASGNSSVDQCGYRIYRSIRRGGAQRPGHHHLHRKAA